MMCQKYLVFVKAVVWKYIYNIIIDTILQLLGAFALFILHRFYDISISLLLYSLCKLLYLMNKRKWNSDIPLV